MAAPDPYAGIGVPVADTKPAVHSTPRSNPQQAQFLEKYNKIRTGLLKTVKPDQQAFAAQRFDSDPRAQLLRKKAGLAPLSTRELDIRQAARNIEQRGRRRKKAGFSISPQEDALAAGVENLLGAGPLIGAGVNFIGDILSGRSTEFKRDLEVKRIENKMRRDRAPAQAFAGEILGGGGGGGIAAKGISAVGLRLASSAAPVASRIGQIIQSATTLQKGQKVKNAARIVGAGAAGGAAQAAGEGSDVATGIAYGAGGALALGAGAKGLGWVGGKASDLFRTTGADRLLRRYTSINADELGRRLENFRKKGKGEATVYELLDLKDRQKFKNISKRMPGSARERSAELSRDRIKAIPGEVASAAKGATAASQRTARNQVALSLASSRGATQPDLDEARLAIRATRDPTEMDTVRSQEAKNVMRPHDDRRAFSGVSDLFPETQQLDAGGFPVSVNPDEEATAIIRSAAGRLMMRNPEQGISVRDTTNLISRLGRMTTSSNAIEANNARNAVEYVMDALERDLPDILPDIQRMRGAWRDRTTMIEGMLEGVKGRTRAQTGFSGVDAGEVRKLYNTPEGTVGRGAGQRFQLTEDLGAATSPALGTVREIAESDTAQRALVENLGRGAAGEITEAAQTQSESVRRLATSMIKQPDSMGDIEGGDLALLAAALNPTSMIITKARAIAVLSELVQGIPESRARTIVDMLYSRDPAMTQRALNALRSSGDKGSYALRNLTQSLAAGVISGSNASNDEMPVEEYPAEDEMPVEEYPAEDEIVDEYEGIGRLPRGREIIQSVFPGAEITEDIRDPESGLGRANPGSHHNYTEGAVDVRPIPGITFEEYVQKLKDAGYEIIEAIDETRNPSGHATGPHWHVVIK